MVNIGSVNYLRQDEGLGKILNTLEDYQDMKVSVIGKAGK